MGARNNLLRRLTSTKWGASPKVLRTTGIALSLSAGEYASPVWNRSVHARLVDTALNDTCRIITGCLKPTPVGMLYPLAGVAPPEVRREVASSIERAKSELDPRHPMFHHIPVPQRLKSRHSFIKEAVPLNGDASQTRQRLWQERYPSASPIPLSEKLPPGHNLPWPTWKSLNRLRTQVGRSKENMFRWGFGPESACECGVSPQTMAHLLSCPACPATCTRKDLYDATDNAVRVAEYWSGRI